MSHAIFVAALVAASTVGQTLTEEQVNKQNQVFQKWWGTDFVWKFDELPLKGSVTAHQMPYSGYIYPDNAGGTVVALQKYDQAFHGNNYLATGHERWDTTSQQETIVTGGGGYVGRFGRRWGGGTSYVRRTPHWHGHCNGWTSATIRHAEPKNSVVRNGVTFTPADIKGLLAELYIYNEMDVIAGEQGHINPAEFHCIMTNWLGRGSHAVAMEADPGKEKWNYPIYAFAAASGRISDRQVEVKMNIGYTRDSRGEFQESPRYNAQKYFHYYLDLNEAGEIVGGGYYRDSARIDMLWIPLLPKESGKPGHERGNPHIKVDEILAIWRESVPEETRKKWLVIDPHASDRVLEVEEGLARLVPLQQFPVAQPAAETVATTESAETPVTESPEAETPVAEAPATESVVVDAAAAETENAPAESGEVEVDAAATEQPAETAPTGVTEQEPADGEATGG